MNSDLGYDERQTLGYFSKYGEENERTDFHQRLLTQNVRKITDMSRDMLVLDVGCGFGRYTDRYEKVCTVIGLDLSIHMLRIARQRLNCDFIRGDARRLPFRDDFFDIALTHGVSTILRDITSSKTIKEMIRVTKRKGKILVIRPSVNSVFSRFLMRKKTKIAHRLSFQLENLMSHFLGKEEIESYGSNAISYPISKVVSQVTIQHIDFRLGSIPIVKDVICRHIVVVGEKRQALPTTKKL